MRKRLVRSASIYVFFLIVFNSVCFGQDPGFSQFYANPLDLNPAFAGTARCPRINLNYRNQWPGIDNSFVTYSASYDQHFDKLNGGLGLIIMNDRTGENVLNTTNIGVIYSNQLEVNRNFSIKFGVQGTYFQRSLKTQNLKFGDMIDPRRGFVLQTNEPVFDETNSFFDASAGFLGFSEKFYFGFAVHHLTEPEETFLGSNSVLPRKYTAHMGAVLPMGIRHEDMSWSPNVMYQTQGTFTHLNLGVYINKGPVVFGLWHRIGDSFIALVGVETDEFKVGYSYDITTSTLSNKAAGSHELSFRMNLPCPPRKVKFKTISCPSF